MPSLLKGGLCQISPQLKLQKSKPCKQENLKKQKKKMVVTQGCSSKDPEQGTKGGRKRSFPKGEKEKSSFCSVSSMKVRLSSSVPPPGKELRQRLCQGNMTRQQPAKHMGGVGVGFVAVPAGCHFASSASRVGDVIDSC